jgi:putative colanic acid biosynthesis acetyltransferase WcaF
MPDPQSTPRNLASYTAAGFDRGASRIKEVFWVLVKLLFFQSGFPWPSALRVFWLRLFGATVGEGVVIRSQVNITFPWRLRIGDHAWIGEEVFILSLAPVTIEASVCVSQRAFLCTGSHDYSKPAFDLKTAPITLRHGSWVAAQAFIGPGVEVGEGTIVAAGSVLMESAPPRVLVRGNPATVIKTLVPPATDVGPENPS